MPPLISPIVSLAMGLARTDLSLIRNSLRTLATGVGSGLTCAVRVAWIMPLEHLTRKGLAVALLLLAVILGPLSVVKKSG